ncbi:hypothetical protein F5Y14DRAFT_449114 [Nemania sp. NC0429]|nr:hypothetical protein F5Y14DRAFT_449114 [Nemania sp. NC0429]
MSRSSACTIESVIANGAITPRVVRRAARRAEASRLEEVARAAAADTTTTTTTTNANANASGSRRCCAAAPCLALHVCALPSQAALASVTLQSAVRAAGCVPLGTCAVLVRLSNPDAFIEHGVSAQSSNLKSQEDRVIVHADFTPDKLIYDPATSQITALLDYGLASVLHPQRMILSTP